MKTHYYAFGSICRGELDPDSDIDLLACVTGGKPNIDSAKFSIYTHHRLTQLWKEGNPFAWHLHLESKLLFSSDGEDFIADVLKTPNRYTQASADCIKFKQLFEESAHSLQTEPNSATFHLSCIFLATRNFATCHSLGIAKPSFSRYSPLLIDRQLEIEKVVFNILVRARILSTRGLGAALTSDELNSARNSLSAIRNWMNSFMLHGASHDRIQ